MAQDSAAVLDSQLEKLAGRAQRTQWSFRDDIDWGAPFHPPRTVPRAVYATLIAQLYHGERATLELCRHLHTTLPIVAARNCLAMQISDETRHIQAYGAYLARLGELPPVDPAIRAALDAAAAWNGSHHALVIALHVILESEALGVQQAFAERGSCPMFTEINSRIAGDEARHIAFGHIYLRHTLADVAADERLAIYRWIKQLWHDGARATFDRYRLVGSVLGLGRAAIEERWSRKDALLRGLGLGPSDNSAAE